MKDAKTILEEFRAIAESRCALSLKNGEYYEGYPLDIEDNNLCFAGGGPLAPEEPFLFPVQDIDLLSLAFLVKTANATWTPVGMKSKTNGSLNHLNQQADRARIAKISLRTSRTIRCIDYVLLCNIFSATSRAPQSSTRLWRFRYLTATYLCRLISVWISRTRSRSVSLKSCGLYIARRCKSVSVCSGVRSTSGSSLCASCNQSCGVCQ